MIKTLMKEIKQYKKASFLTIFYVIIEVVFEILIPFMMAKIIDDGIQAQNINAIIQYGLIMLVLVIGTLSTGFLAGKYAAYASAGFAANLRNVYSHSNIFIF